MATIGLDCHVTIQHDAINTGAAYGFILDSESDLGPIVSVQREATTSSDPNAEPNQTARVFFNVLLSDKARQPNGAISPLTKSAQYAMLQNFLRKTSAITLVSPQGIMANLGALGHICTEQHYGAITIIAVQLNNVGVFWPAADPSRYALSQWVNRDTYVGGMNWNNSYWRDRS